MSRNISYTVRPVDILLEELSGELASSLNPHRLALQSLGIREYGWLETPYSDEAFKIWSDLLRKQPDDIDTLHHLAIMHHARAIDLEAGKDPRESDADWGKAFEYWHQLWRSDDFWNRIAEKACKKERRDPVDKLRDLFPVLLLAINFDIAFDPKTKNHRATHHIKAALRSSFPGEAKEAVRKNAYDRFMSSVPQTIWQGSERNTEVIKEGTDRIKKYLELDPGCVPALEDALRLQERLLSAWFTKLQGLGEHESADRKRLLNTMKSAADEWKPYLEQLVPLAGQLDDTSRGKLSLWLRVMGDVHRALDQPADAIPYYQQGKDAGRKEDPQRRMCSDRLGESHAYMARERAKQQGAAARPLCDEVRKRKDLPASAYNILAQAYAIMKDFDTAEAVCRQGQSVDVDASDIEAMRQHESDLEDLARLLEQIGEVRARHSVEGTLNESNDLIQRGRVSDALLLLNKAEEIAPTEMMIYFLRSRCYERLGLKAEAMKDLLKFKSFLSELDPADAASIKGATSQLEAKIKRMP